MQPEKLRVIGAIGFLGRHVTSGALRQRHAARNGLSNLGDMTTVSSDSAQQHHGQKPRYTMEVGIEPSQSLIDLGYLN